MARAGRDIHGTHRRADSGMTGLIEERLIGAWILRGEAVQIRWGTPMVRKGH